MKRNTEYRIVLDAPLLRPGMTIEVGPVSEGHVVEEAKKAMEKAREINSPEPTPEPTPEPLHVCLDRLGRPFRVLSVMVAVNSGTPQVLYGCDFEYDMITRRWQAEFVDTLGSRHYYDGVIGEPVDAPLYLLCDDINDYLATQ